jgi:hypothetical protein
VRARIAGGMGEGRGVQGWRRHGRVMLYRVGGGMGRVRVYVQGYRRHQGVFHR